MTNKKIKTYTLEEMKNKHIGARGTEPREQYEYALRMEIISELIRKTRLEKKMTQEELGYLEGSKKPKFQSWKTMQTAQQ